MFITLFSDRKMKLVEKKMTYVDILLMIHIVAHHGNCMAWNTVPTSYKPDAA